MGSVRRANSRQYLAFLLLNVIVSAVTIILVMAVWGRVSAPAEPTATPTLDAAALIASAVPTPTVTVPPSPTPVTYTVKSGDTLFSIAIELEIPSEALMAANGLTDPDKLAVGQVLLVPSLEEAEGMIPTSTPRPTQPLFTLTPNPDSQAPQVEIRGVTGLGDLAREAAFLLNSGGVAAMAGWSMDDGKGHVYQFPEFTLHSGAVSVHTRAGVDTVIDLYWGLDQAVWTSGTVITLRDASGAVHSRFNIP
ncbi:MAG TPA: LysM peptidoglycan-binding domain-containing protein [Anaerolineales bacterium]|nr:LysM peptidoglycan-binding domain-containing protein [Anaerolineales bacterium]